ncbi:MAG: hypothetical protein B7Z16_13515 [Algoriphagus sp. 32-45-6]|nr:MAG: hypothetical protein B7Z16_13515 [Algoriphagus sp. 32-45-6]
MAKDFKLWSPLARVNSNGIPVRAIYLNTVISLILFLSGSFEQVMLYTGFVLQLMGTVTIFSSLKIQTNLGFRTPLKPVLQIIYILFSLGVMYYMLTERPIESLAGFGLLSVGLILFLLDKKKT